MRYLLLCLVLSLGCTPDETPGWAPVARLTLAPLHVPVGVATTIVLDGRKSCDALDSPELCDTREDGPGCPDICPGGIRYSWHIPGLQGSYTPLRANHSIVEATVRINRPVTISLTVTDCDDLSSTKSVVLGVSD